jgi:hypothetical protein
VLDKEKLAVAGFSQEGLGTILRTGREDLVIENIHAVRAVAIVADYFGKKLVIEPELQTDDHLNIILPNDTSVETAIMCLNSMSKTAQCRLHGDTIFVFGK